MIWVRTSAVTLPSEQDKAPGLPVRVLIHNETNVAKALAESANLIAIFYTFFPLSSLRYGALFSGNGMPDRKQNRCGY
jgi:hypothetical protein